MSKQLATLLGLFCLSTSLFATMSTEPFFSPDTVLTAGDYQISCEQKIESSSSSPWSSSTDTSYTDSLGRNIKSSRIYRNSKGNTSFRNFHRVEIDSQSRITICYDSIRHTVPGNSITKTDTLIADDWNEKGMIISGTLFTRTAQRGPRIIYSQKEISILYDETGVNATDTLIQSSFASDTMNSSETPVLLSGQKITEGITFQQNSNRVTLQKVPGETDVRLFSLNGKMIQHKVADMHGEVQMNLNNLSKGVYLLKSNKKSFKVVVQQGT